MATSKTTPNTTVNSITAALNEAMDFVMAGANNYRSSAKLSTLHDFIGRSALAAVRKEAQKHPGLDPAKFTVRTQITPNGEYKITENDIFFTHDCDVSLFYDGVLITVEEVKFFLRSFGKNARNYKSAMIGETSNIHHAGARCVQLIFVPDAMPNLGDGGVIQGWEALPVEDDNDYQHMMATWYGTGVRPENDCPDALYIGVFGHPKQARLDDLYDYDDYRAAYRQNGWKLHASRRQVADEHYFLNCYDKFVQEVARITCREAAQQAQRLALVA